jgi:hypothetical protein
MWKSIFILVLAFLSSYKLQADPIPSLDRFHVCTVASYKTENLNKLLLSCEINHIDLEVVGLGLPYYGNGTKLIRMAEYLKTLDDDEIVMFVDAFDVIIVADKEVLLEKFLSMNIPFLMSAEKNCFPAHLKNRYPPIQNSFKYINTGSYIGYVKDLKAWLDDLPAIKPSISDQLQVSVHYLDGHVYFNLDYHCELFLPLFLVKDNEIAIDVEKRIVHCLTTNSEPCVIHANGKSFRIWKIIYQKLVAK